MSSRLPPLLLAGLGAATDIAEFLAIFLALIGFAAGGFALARPLPADGEKREKG